MKKKTEGDKRRGRKSCLLIKDRARETFFFFFKFSDRGLSCVAAAARGERPGGIIKSQEENL